jgi:phosphoglycolate phosphatase
VATSERGTVICDLDGTLVDSAPDLADALDELLTERKLEPVGLDGTRKLIGHGIVNLVRKGLELRGQTVTSLGLEAAAARYRELYAKRLPARAVLYPGVHEALRSLKSQNWRLVVCTNKLEAFSRSILEGLKVAHFFDVIAGPDTYGVAKPDPQHMLRTLPPDRTTAYLAVVVGDSEVDVATAQAAKLPVIAMSYGYSKTPLSSLNPDAIAANFGDVPRLVQELTARQGVRS